MTAIQSPQPESGGHFGFGVSGAGDFNNDGYDDFIVGAPLELNTSGTRGAAHVFSGANGSVMTTLKPPHPEGGSWFGQVVSKAGDLNNDGYDDILIAAPLDAHGGNNGIVYVFSGATGDTIFTLGSPNPETGSTFGSSVDAAGNVNNDGVTDLLVGAPLECPEGVINGGRAYLFSGLDGSLIHTLEPDYPAADGNFGASLSGLGDVDDDGHSDFAVGAHGETVGGVFYAGRIYVYSGATGDTLYSIPAPAPQNGGYFGDTVEMVGDLNEDGKPEFAVGATGTDYEGILWAGRVYIFDSVSGDLLTMLHSRFPVQSGGFGQPLSNTGDIDGDGHDDLLVGARYEEAGIYFRAGRAYLFSGASGDTIATFIHHEPDYHLNFASALAGTGDINGDGLGDFLIGAPIADAGGITNAGHALLYASGEFAVGINPEKENPLKTFELHQNYPNPFNPATTIRFTLSSPAEAILTIYDV